MHRLGLAATLAAACYSPSAQPLAPCGPGGECPSGQECRSTVCYPVGTPDDASLIETPPAIDASPDAFVGWTTPVQLTSLQSTAPLGESDPTVSGDRLTAVITGGVATGDTDLYLGTRTALTDSFTLTALTTVSATGFKDVSPELSPDGLTLFFSSNRSGAYEIYVSTFSGGVWSSPTLRTDLSSTSDDLDLAISPDGLTAAVVRDNSPNRIYVYTRANTGANFSGPTIHTELNVTLNVAGPTITNGGAIMYLHAGATRDIYRATLKGNGDYTNPQLLDEVNTPNRDAAPFVNQADDYMIFEREGDIFETSRL